MRCVQAAQRARPRGAATALWPPARGAPACGAADAQVRRLLGLPAGARRVGGRRGRAASPQRARTRAASCVHTQAREEASGECHMPRKHASRASERCVARGRPATGARTPVDDRGNALSRGCGVAIQFHAVPSAHKPRTQARTAWQAGLDCLRQPQLQCQRRFRSTRRRLKLSALRFT